MAKQTQHVALLCLVSIAAVLAGPHGGPPGDENLPEECKPKKPEPGEQREECCKLPHPSKEIMESKKALLKECAEKHGMPHPGPPHAEGEKPEHPHEHPPHEHHPHGPPHHNPCIEECLLEESHYLTPEKTLNAEEISSKLLKEFELDPAWSSVAEEAVKTCLQTAAAEVPEDGVCKSGAMEFRRCMMRTLYLNCPSSFKSTSESCTAEHALLEKCPNLFPPPPHHDHH